MLGFYDGTRNLKIWQLKKKNSLDLASYPEASPSEETFLHFQFKLVSQSNSMLLVYFIFLLAFNITILVIYLFVCMDTQLLSPVQFFVTPWTVACLVSESMGLFQQEYWSGLPFPPGRNLPDLGIEPEL